MRKLVVFIILILISVGLFSLNTLPTKSQMGESEWILEERGCNYDIYYNSANPSQKRWVSAHQRVLNSTGHWVDYIFTNKYATDKYVTVQSGLIGAEFHKGKVVYYSPDLTRLAVERENWLVFKWNSGESKWKPVCASLEKYFSSASFIKGDDYVNVTGTWTTAAGNLAIVYHFCGTLKHTVFWTPNNAGKYAVVQAWNGTQYDKVKLYNATIIKRTDDVIIGKSDALTALFYNETQPFGIFENQGSAEDLLHKVVFAGGAVNYQGISLTDAVGWIFYNSSYCDLVSGENLTIDPTTNTFSLSDAIYDGYVWGENTIYSTAHSTVSGKCSESGDAS